LLKNPFQPHLRYSLGAYDLLIEAFLKSLEERSEPPVPIREALSSLRVAESYTAACNTDRTIAT
jgi:hypothetical protein